MGLDITILVGTMTGTAEMVAQEVQQALEAAGHQATIRMMDGLDASVFQGGGTFLICTSTYGQGDVPDNAQALFNSLEAEKPNLTGVTYGVIALGDRTYKDTYCHGGMRFDKLLTELGGQARRRNPDPRRQLGHAARRGGGAVGRALGRAAPRCWLCENRSYLWIVRTRDGRAALQRRVSAAIEFRHQPTADAVG